MNYYTYKMRKPPSAPAPDPELAELKRKEEEERKKLEQQRIEQQRARFGGGGITPTDKDQGLGG